MSVILPTGDFQKTTLSGSLTNNATTMTIGTGLTIPATGGVLEIDYDSTTAVGLDNGPETIIYTSYTTGTGAVAGMTRGQAGTTGVAHANGAKVQCGASSLYWATDGIYPASLIKQEAWTAYTTTWGNTGTANTLGNGTKTAFYVRIGNTIHYRIDLVWGSTTASGNGDWTFTLPTATKTGYITEDMVGMGNAHDHGTAEVPTFAYWSTTTVIKPTYLDASGAYAFADGIAAISPFTWAVNDIFTLAGTYERA